MILDKKQMTEEDVKLQYITPAIQSKWGLDRITMETRITDGQINLKEMMVDGFDKAKKFTARQLAEELGYNLDQCGYPHVEEEILAPMDLIQRYQEERSSLNAEIDRVLAEITEKLGGAK